MTTSVEIDKYMSEHKEHISGGLLWKGVFASDELPSLNSSDYLQGCCLIMNYDPSYKSGSHWVGLRISGGEGFGSKDRTVSYFDSYGEDADKDDEILSDKTSLSEYIDKIPHQHYLFNEYDLQAIGSDVCGLYSIYFCLHGLPIENEEAWRDFHKAPKAVIEGKQIRLNAPFAKENDDLIKMKVKISVGKMGGSGLQPVSAATGDLYNLQSSLYGLGFYKDKTIKQIKGNPITGIQAVRFEKKLGERQIQSLNKKGVISKGSETHGVVFTKDSWTPSQAEKWLMQHNFKPIKPVDITANQLRYRMIEPDEFADFRYKYLGDGISLILGFHKKLNPDLHKTRVYIKKKPTSI